MKHPLLGEIKPSKDVPDAGAAMIRFGSRDIEVHIEADGRPFELTLQLAADVVVRLDELDKIAKKVAADVLRQKYNSTWREFEEELPDGSMRVVSNRPYPKRSSSKSCRSPPSMSPAQN